jgi:hypothetical protein
MAASARLCRILPKCCRVREQLAILADVSHDGGCSLASTFCPVR